MGIKERLLNGLSVIYTRANDFIREEKLSNGISFASQKRFPGSKLYFSVFINAGSYEDPEGKQGVAHFLEHLLIGSETHHKIQKLGGSINLATSASFIRLDGSLPYSKENQAILCQIISEFLNASDMSEEAYIREKRRILNEIGISYDNASDVHLSLMAAGFDRGRADGNVLGTRDNVRDITYEDLTIFREKFFTGKNIFIGITGVSSYDEMKKQLEDDLSDIKTGLPNILFSPSVKQGYFNTENNHLLQTYFDFCFPVEKIHLNKSAIFSIASNYFSAKIDQDIIFGSGIVYSAYLRPIVNPLRDGYFNITGNIMAEEAEKIIPEVQNVIIKAIEGIDEDVFRGVKSSFLSSAVQGFMPAFNAADTLASCMMHNGGNAPQSEWRAKLEAVTPEDIHRYFVDEVFSNLPSISTYGDDSKFGKYEDFVAPIHDALARINTPKP